MGHWTEKLAQNENGDYIDNVDDDVDDDVHDGDDYDGGGGGGGGDDDDDLYWRVGFYTP